MVVPCIANMNIYYIVGHGGYIAPDCEAEADWVSQSHVYFMAPLGNEICQARMLISQDASQFIETYIVYYIEVQLASLIEIEKGLVRNVMKRAEWVATAHPGGFPHAHTKPDLQTRTRIPTMLVSPIETPYGGI